MRRSIGENLGKKLFFFEFYPFTDLDFENLYLKDISKTITARSFKLGQLIEDDEEINW